MLEWLEFEERVGTAWHRMVGNQATYAVHRDAAVALDEVRPMLSVFFHALGGARHVEVAATAESESGHRLTLKQRLGVSEEKMALAALSETSLRLPPRVAYFPARALNRDLYIWLAAYFAVAEPVPADPDPLRHDLAVIAAARRATGRALAEFPGLRKRYLALAEALIAQRPDRPLPPTERLVEEAVLAALRLQAAPDLSTLPSERRYKPFLPVPLWGEVLAAATSAPRGDGEAQDPDDPDHDGDSGPDDDRKRKAKRKEQEQADRNDPLILNRFEKILALADMINLNRPTDDDEDDDARKAADDMEEITVSEHTQKPASRIRLDLDLPPEANIGERLIGTYTYPEWDYRKQVLLPDHCVVQAETAEEEGVDWEPDEEARRLIRRVRRQFEALRPRQMTFRRQADGDDLDLEAVVRARCDMAATGEISNRLYQKTRAFARDLSVGVLMDVSLSTDSWIDDRRVLDVEKEALSVLLSGLSACGDENAVFTFTSRKRKWVRMQTVKDFDEPFGDHILRRIGALKPGFYTRIGAAVRHATAQLEKRPHRHRLLLILTDGKPNDVDHYEGRFGIEDSRRAILEARRKGLTVFGVTIDRKAQDYFPLMFGRGNYAIVGNLHRLSRALPRIYQSLSQG